MLQYHYKLRQPTAAFKTITYYGENLLQLTACLLITTVAGVRNHNSVTALLQVMAAFTVITNYDKKLTQI